MYNFLTIVFYVNQLAPGKSTDGRITQDVAKAFKARACLTRACATGEASLCLLYTSLFLRRMVNRRITDVLKVTTVRPILMQSLS